MQEFVLLLLLICLFGYHGYPCSSRESNPCSPSQEHVTMHARPSLVRFPVYWTHNHQTRVSDSWQFWAKLLHGNSVGKKILSSILKDTIFYIHYSSNTFLLKGGLVIIREFLEKKNTRWFSINKNISHPFMIQWWNIFSSISLIILPLYV